MSTDIPKNMSATAHALSTNDNLLLELLLHFKSHLWFAIESALFKLSFQYYMLNQRSRDKLTSSNMAWLTVAMELNPL